MIAFDEFYKNELAKSPKLRKAKYNMQWEMDWQTAMCAQIMRLNAGLTQVQMAKRTKIHQPSLARAEAYGCSITMLAKIAKAVGKKIVIKVEEPEKLIK
jgi:hypothetical protein